MIFNKEQINIKNFYFNDVDFGDLSEDQMLQIFNSLPPNIQGLAISWGFSDTVFGDCVFVWIINNQFGITVEEYYAKGMSDNQYVFDFNKLNNKG